MSIPSQVENAGNTSTAQNVFRVTFSQALAAPPTIESWDDATFSSTTKEQFAGTSVNGHKPYVSAVATTDAAPASNWKPSSAVGGGATANRLKGTTNYVNASAAAPGSGGTIRFNLDFELPSDMSIPSTSVFGVLAVRYSYSGTAPTLTWQYNDAGAGGTESVPVWITITPGSSGAFIRPTDAGATPSNLSVTKPSSGVADAAQIWVTNT